MWWRKRRSMKAPEMKSEGDRCLLEPQREDKSWMWEKWRWKESLRSGEGKKGKFNSRRQIQNASVFNPHEKTNSECVVPVRGVLAFHTETRKKISHKTSLASPLIHCFFLLPSLLHHRFGWILQKRLCKSRIQVRLLQHTDVLRHYQRFHFRSHSTCSASSLMCGRWAQIQMPSFSDKRAENDHLIWCTSIWAEATDQLTSCQHASGHLLKPVSLWKCGEKS